MTRIDDINDKKIEQIGVILTGVQLNKKQAELLEVIVAPLIALSKNNEQRTRTYS